LKALFVTTRTSEPIENVRAWAHTTGPAEHVTFDINGPNNDEAILCKAKKSKPDLIFYTGGTDGKGLPTDDTLRALRKLAPTVMLQGDFGDPPFHPVIAHYRQAECFDLFVAMDGVKSAPVDHVTLTPFDPVRFGPPPRSRSIHCGFAGNHVRKERHEEVLRTFKTFDPRSAILHAVGDLVRLREREIAGDYADYIAFFQKCRLVLNTSFAGSGTAHHVKGRVLEAGFSGAAILEQNESPLADWFPSDTFYSYGSPLEAQQIILSLPYREIEKTAIRFRSYAMKNYTGQKIYRGILEKLGL
jgi:hypothetical protein